MAATDNKDATMLGRFGKDAGSLVGVEIAPTPFGLCNCSGVTGAAGCLPRYKSRSNHRLAVTGRQSLAPWRLP